MMASLAAEVGKRSLLTREEEVALSKRVRKGDESAVHELVLRNLRLAVMVAKRYASSQVPLDDLIAEGFVGLTIAARKYDWRRGTRLSTFATWYVRMCIARAVERRSVVVPSSSAAGHAGRLMRLRGELGREPTPKEARITPSQMELAKAAAAALRGCVQLQKIGRRNQEEDTWGEPTVRREGQALAGRELPPDAAAESLDDAGIYDETLKRAVDCLDERERAIVRRRFGFGAAPQTLEEIGRDYGLSKERVRQLADRAMRKMRAELGVGAEPSVKTPAAVPESPAQAMAVKVRAIRESTEPLKKLSKRHGISMGQVSRIRRGLSRSRD